MRSEMEEEAEKFLTENALCGKIVALRRNGGTLSYHESISCYE